MDYAYEWHNCTHSHPERWQWSGETWRGRIDNAKRVARSSVYRCHHDGEG